MNGNKKSAKQYHQSVITALEKKVNDMKDANSARTVRLF